MNTLKTRSAVPLVLLGALAAVTLPLDARQLPLPLPSLPVPIPLLTFAPGDLLISIETGPVMWRTSDGLITRVLPQTVPGTGEGMTFDEAGNLYVTRWCVDPFCGQGDTGSVEKYNNSGSSLGEVGAVWNCQPHTILSSAPGTFYVGQSGCAKTIMQTPLDGTLTAEYHAAEDFGGIFWMDLGPDDCTMYYTSFGPNVKRYDVCGDTQLPDFNVAPLPGGMAQDLRVLADGSVLVASGEVIALLDPAGAIARTYEVPGEAALWCGLDLVGDGTFWVGNYFSSNVFQINLDDGRVVSSFNTGTPANSVVGIRVKR
jgi:hypothetical protein